MSGELVGPRLSMRTLGQADGVAVPGYDRTAPPAIVHLGLGAFARAHVGVYADALLRAGWPATIRGVSLRNSRAEAELAPQDGLYTVTEREPGRRASSSVIGSVTSASTGPEVATAAMASPATRLVTLTVTEKGYEMEGTDPARPDPPWSAAAAIVRALAAHRSAGTAPPTIASLDNVLDNGCVLREGVLDVATRLAPDLRGWIADVVRFPSSVVDRMVPATTPADRDEIAAALGLLDHAAVVTEHHRSWVIADEGELPPFADVGVQVVADVAPFQQRKLWLLNGPHSAAAYCGLLVGRPTIATALGDTAVAAFVRRLADEILEVTELPAALAAPAFAADVLRRFENPSLGHTCAEVGTDGSAKLPQRLLPVVAARRHRALDTTRFALVAAIWIAAVAGIAVPGTTLARLEDPTAKDLAAAAAGTDLCHVAAVALREAADPAFTLEVADALRQLAAKGRAVLDARS